MNEEEPAQDVPRGTKRAMDPDSELESADDEDASSNASDTHDRKRIKREDRPPDPMEGGVSEAEQPEDVHPHILLDDAGGQDFYKPIALELHWEIHHRLLTNDPGAYATDIVNLGRTDRVRNTVLKSDEIAQSRLKIIKDVRAVHDKALYGSADGAIPEDIVGQCAAAEFFSIRRREDIADLVCDGGEFSQRWFQDSRIQESVSILVEKAEYYKREYRDKIYGCAVIVMGYRDEIPAKLYAQREHFTPEQQENIRAIHHDHAGGSVSQSQENASSQQLLASGPEHAARRLNAIAQIKTADAGSKPEQVENLLRRVAAFDEGEIRSLFAEAQSIADPARRAEVYLAFAERMGRDPESPSRIPSDVADAIVSEARAFKESDKALPETGHPSADARSPSPDVQSPSQEASPSSPAPSEASISFMSEPAAPGGEEESPMVTLQRAVSRISSARWNMMMNRRPRGTRGD